MTELPATRAVVIEAITTLLPSSPELKDRADRLARLLAGTPTGWLPALDLEVRWHESWRSHPWETMGVAEARRLLGGRGEVVAGMEASGAAVAVAAGLSMHRNGHIRELAVRHLAASGEREALRWLVLRCGDWVAPVRDAALAAVEPVVGAEHAPLLVSVLPLLSGARFQSGRPTDRLAGLVETALRSSAARAAVEDGLVGSDRRVRRACAHLLADGAPAPALVERVLAVHDIVATSLLLRGMPTDGAGSGEVGRLLLRSPMARFRAEGLWRVLQSGTETDHAAPAARRALVDAALVDAAPAVREVAQRWLTERGEDPRSQYLALLTDRPAIALMGLGDRPRAEDAALARAAVDDEVAAVRVAALRLLAALGAPEDEALFAARFQVGSARERRHALAGIRRCGAGPRLADALWTAALASGDAQQTARFLFQVVPGLGIWRRLHYGLEAAGSADPEIVDQGLEALRRGIANPPHGYRTAPANLDELRERLGRLELVIKARATSELYAKLTFALQTA